MSSAARRPLGEPRHHHATVGSTNDVARELAADGAAHGTVVTADEQTAGRGRQGRAWVTTPGTALAASVILRDLGRPELLPLQVAVAVAGACGPDARIKWPNDVVLVGSPGEDATAEPSSTARPETENADPPTVPPLRKLAGILCEGRAGAGWVVAGIGLNVAVDVAELPPDVARRAATLGLAPEDRDRVLADVLDRLADALLLPVDVLLAAWSTRDVLRGSRIRWEDATGTHEGTADGVDGAGALVARCDDGSTARLDAGEVHLAATGS